MGSLLLVNISPSNAVPSLGKKIEKNILAVTPAIHLKRLQTQDRRFVPNTTCDFLTLKSEENE
jgi:hypothetical protein